MSKINPEKILANSKASKTGENKASKTSSIGSDQPTLTLDEIEDSKGVEYRSIRIYLKIINPSLFIFSLLYGFNIFSQIAFYFSPRKSDSIELTAVVIGYNLVALFLTIMSYFVLHNGWLRSPYLRWISGSQWLLTMMQFLGIVSVLMPSGVPGRHKVYVRGPARERNIFGERIPSYTIVTFVIGFLLFLSSMTLAILICCLHCTVERVKKLDKNETFLLREQKFNKKTHK